MKLLRPRGELFVHCEPRYKYFVLLEELCSWLYRDGFTADTARNLLMERTGAR